MSEGKTPYRESKGLTRAFIEKFERVRKLTKGENIREKMSEFQKTDACSNSFLLL